MGSHKGQVSKRKRVARKKKRKAQRKRDAEITKKYGMEGHRMCGRKRRYEDEFTAQSVANLSMIAYGAPPLKVYRCPLCGGWHLTHKA